MLRLYRDAHQLHLRAADEAGDADERARGEMLSEPFAVGPADFPGPREVLVEVRGEDLQRNDMLRLGVRRSKRGDDVLARHRKLVDEVLGDRAVPRVAGLTRQVDGPAWCRDDDVRKPPRR